MYSLCSHCRGNLRPYRRSVGDRLQEGAPGGGAGYMSAGWHRSYIVACTLLRKIGNLIATNRQYVLGYCNGQGAQLGGSQA